MRYERGPLAHPALPAPSRSRRRCCHRARRGQSHPADARDGGLGGCAQPKVERVLTRRPGRRTPPPTTSTVSARRRVTPSMDFLRARSSRRPSAHLRPVSGLSDIWISSDTRPFSHYLTLPDNVRRLSVSTRNDVLAGKRISRISGSPVARVESDRSPR